jgi:hypothetical protein
MGKRPSELLAWQENAKGRQRYVLLDLMFEHVQERGGTYSSMVTRLSHLRSFFFHNRVEVPSIAGWQPQPTREPSVSTLTLVQVRDIITHASLRDTATLLTLFQGLMDLERFSQFNRKYAAALVKHLNEKSLDDPFRVDFISGRKRNRRPFYTFLHHDALQAWKNYFEKERGWPREKEPIAVTEDRRPPTKDAIRSSFNTIARKLRIKPRYPQGQRTGISPHEFRDVARTLLQTAKKKNFDVTCCEYWMGHRIDPYNYNKFAEQEPGYVLENARIAAEYLNIVTGTAGQDRSQEMESLREEVAKLRGQFETILKTRFDSEKAR